MLETVPSIPVLLKQFMMPVQSWIGTFIQVVKFYLLPKAPAIIRNGESQYESFTREM